MEVVAWLLFGVMPWVHAAASVWMVLMQLFRADDLFGADPLFGACDVTRADIEARAAEVACYQSQLDAVRAGRGT